MVDWTEPFDWNPGDKILAERLQRNTTDLRYLKDLIDSYSGSLTTHKTASPIDHPDLSITNAKINDVDAGKVSSGTLGVDRIPSLDVAKITTGRFGMPRMPAGTSGYVLTAQGAGVDPAYSTVPPPSSFGDVIPDGADTRDLGSTSKEWKDLFIGDAGKIFLGLSQDVDLYRSAANVLKTEDNFDALALRIGGTEVIDSSRSLVGLASLGQTILPSLDLAYYIGDPTHRLYSVAAGFYGVGGETWIIQLVSNKMRFAYSASAEMELDSSGNLWIAGKLTQAGCPEFSKMSMADVRRMIVDSTKKEIHTTQEEVLALAHFALDMDERLKRVEKELEDLKKRAS